MSTRQVGDQAESVAVRYLEDLGFEILKRNYQIRGGEIDIIAMDRETLVFIEVKARFSHEFGEPLESITPWKVKALLRTAMFYVVKSGWGDKPYRIDALSIDYTEDRNHPKIELVKNITL